MPHPELTLERRIDAELCGLDLGDVDHDRRLLRVLGVAGQIAAGLDAGSSR